MKRFLGCEISHRAAVLIILIVSVTTSMITGCYNRQKKDPLTPEERAWLTENDGKIVLAHDPDAAPIDFLDEKGEFRGLAADYVKLLEKKLNFTFNIIHPPTWAEVIEKAKNQEVDVLCAFSKSPEREEYMLFTDPYISIKVVILTTNDFKGALTLEEMKGMRVTYTEGWIVDDYLNDYLSIIEEVPAPNPTIAMSYLTTGYADAWVTALTVASIRIEESKVANLRIAGETDLAFNLSFASRKDWPMLNQILKKGLASITEKERTDIFNKWIHINTQNMISREMWIVLILLGLGILITIFVITAWNRTLKKQVHVRTLELNKELKEKEVLLREIHHRVKNNMQITSGLIEIQTSNLRDSRDIEIFKDVQNKIKTMSLVHEKLYQSKDFSNINFKEYVDDLLQDLFISYGVDTSRISSEIDIEDVLFEVDFATPCGLIINELASNSLKHAFPADRKGIIGISLRSLHDEFELIVQDNGIGLQLDGNLETITSFGLNLVIMLVEGQLDGTIKADASAGTKYTINFRRPTFSDSLEIK